MRTEEETYKKRIIEMVSSIEDEKNIKKNIPNNNYHYKS